MHAPPTEAMRPAAHGAACAVVLPARQAAQGPEQAAEARPAELPNVPAGQSEQMLAPASENVPG